MKPESNPRIHEDKNIFFFESIWSWSSNSSECFNNFLKIQTFGVLLIIKENNFLFFIEKYKIARTPINIITKICTSRICWKINAIDRIVIPTSKLWYFSAKINGAVLDSWNP